MSGSQKTDIVDHDATTLAYDNKSKADANNFDSAISSTATAVPFTVKGVQLPAKLPPPTLQIPDRHWTPRKLDGPQFQPPKMYHVADKP